MAENIRVEVDASFKGEGSVRRGAEALDQVAQSAGRAVGAAGKAKKEFVEVAGAFTAMAVGKQITEGLFGVVGMLDTVAKGMGKVRTVLNESIVPSDTVRNVIHNVASETGRDFESISTVLRDLIAQGYNPATVANETFLGSLIKFQRVAEIDEHATSGLIKGLNNMGVGGTKRPGPSIKLQQSRMHLHLT